MEGVVFVMCFSCDVLNGGLVLSFGSDSLF